MQPALRSASELTIMLQIRIYSPYYWMYTVTRTVRRTALVPRLAEQGSVSKISSALPHKDRAQKNNIFQHLNHAARSPVRRTGCREHSKPPEASVLSQVGFWPAARTLSLQLHHTAHTYPLRAKIGSCVKSIIMVELKGSVSYLIISSCNTHTIMRGGASTC